MGMIDRTAVMVLLFSTSACSEGHASPPDQVSAGLPTQGSNTAMLDPKLTGEWELVASAAIQSEIASASDEPGPQPVAAWLNSYDMVLPADSVATSGLTLSLHPDGSFADRLTGKPRIEWFDAEGVLVPEVSPLVGTTKVAGDTAYLTPRGVPRWAEPIEGRYAPAILRYDDGDTKIADGVRLTADGLVRTVNVVTDELYLTRVVLLYRKRGG